MYNMCALDNEININIIIGFDMVFEIILKRIKQKYMYNILLKYKDWCMLDRFCKFEDYYIKSQSIFFYLVICSMDSFTITATIHVSS